MGEMILMGIELQYTSSIFQLAIGLNAVFPLLSSHYSRLKREMVVIVLEELRRHEPEFASRGKEKHIENFMFDAMFGYRAFRWFTRLCMVLSMLSLLVSFGFLLEAATHHDSQISERLLTFLACSMILFSPTIYYLFVRGSEWFISEVRKRLDFDEIDVEALKISISAQELGDWASEVVERSQLEAYKILVKSRLGSIRHRIGALPGIAKRWRRR